MDIEKARQELKGRVLLTGYLKKARKGGYVCPHCQSGEGPHGTGAVKYYSDTNTAYCHACGKSVDVIDLYQYEHDCGFAEACNALYAIWGHDVAPQVPKPAVVGKSDAEVSDFTGYYTATHKALMESKEALDYLHRRGLEDETIEHFGLGFDPSWKNPGGTFGNETGRIIIPLSASGYLARAIDPVGNGEKIHVGKKHPFNLSALTPDAGTARASAEHSTPPIVVEGAFDAMTLWQWGYKNAIALNGRFAGDLIDRAKSIAPDAVFILVLDNDPPGREAQEKEAAKMSAAGLNCLCADPAEIYTGGAKDANEVQRQGKAEAALAGLAPYIQAALEQRAADEQRRAKERYAQTGSGMVDAFMAEITSEKYRPLSTGIPALDNAAGGGLMRQTLVLLGAEPGAGKTALASMIFENMARQGHLTFYFNLEMSRNQLIARSLARIIAQTEGKKMTAVEILQGYKHTDEHRTLIERAVRAYKACVAGGVVYNPWNMETGLSGLLEALEDEARRQKAAGRPAPLVCVDYLQLLTGNDQEDAGAVLKRAVTGLKGYAVRHDSIVFAIMAQSRAVNRSGEASISAGRDTSALEYSADLQLQLVREDAEKPDRVTLYVTKNRFGVADTRKGHGTEFTFMGGQSLFIPIDATRDATCKKSTRKTL